jgi:tetratricopeptide (TPR) repeat protein
MKTSRVRGDKEVHNAAGQEPPAFWRRYWRGFLLLVIVGVCYLPALGGGWILDDDVYVTANPHLRSVDGLRHIWLEPGALPDCYAMVYSLFWVEFHAWGLAPLGFHAVNIALHAGCVFLLWRLLVRLSVPGAWLAAAIFAAHPVCVESVAWVSEGKNTLSLLLALGSILAYLRFEPLPAVGDSAACDRRRWYVLSIALFGAALLAKTQVAVLPAVLLLIFWWKRGTVQWKAARPLIPFFVLAGVMAGLTIWIETRFNGASGEAYAHSVGERFLIAGRAFWFYLGKLVWPQPLVFIYPRWAIDPGQWRQFVFPAAGGAVFVACCFARSRIGRGPIAVVLIVAALLFPVSGFFNVCYQRFSFVADHFQYHAACAMIALAVAAIWTLTQWIAVRISNRHQLGYGAGALAAAVVAICALASLQRCRVFADAQTLYEDTLAKNPNCPVVENNLANVLLQSGQTDRAIDHFRRAIELKADYAEAHANLAAGLVERGRYEEAIEHYQKAIGLKPNYSQAHNGLGLALAKTSHAKGAIEQYELATQLKPNFADPQNNLGALLLATGNREGAIEHLQRAVQLAPDDATAHSNLGSALLQSRPTAAIEQFEIALRLNPDLAEAHNLLGAALEGAHHSEQAIEHYREAVRAKPDYVEAHFNLGHVLLATGRPQEAIPQLRQVVRLLPNDIEAAVNLALAYAAANRPDDAIAAAERAGGVAQSTGQAAQAERIRGWLTSYRAKIAGQSLTLRDARTSSPPR